MAGCCNHDAQFDGVSREYKRRLWAVIAINAAMFFVEMAAGQAANSQALKADALDFLGDALTYGISLAVIGASLRTRSMAAIGKGVSLLLMGSWVLGSTVWKVFVVGVPEAQVMGYIGFMALAANLLSVALLAAYKDADANVRSVWLCSRNDAVGNVAERVQPPEGHNGPLMKGASWYDSMEFFKDRMRGPTDHPQLDVGWGLRCARGMADSNDS